MRPGEANELSQQRVSRTGASTMDRYLAYATLYDLLSRAFAYPNAEFYAVLHSRDFAAQVSAAVSALPETPMLKTAHAAMQSAVAALAAECPLAQLESDYIALFDASRDLPALHPYARLYGEQAMNPATLLQRLQAIYREQGLELDADHGAEQADHITVQLEFMALLYRRLAQTPDDPAALEDAKAFLAQLAWLPRFVATLDERSIPHQLYHPLAHFLAALYAGESVSERTAV